MRPRAPVAFSAEKGPSRPPSREPVPRAAFPERLRHGEAGCCYCCCEPERAGSPFPLTGSVVALRPWTEVFLAVRAARKAALREGLTPVRAASTQFWFQPKRKRCKISRPGKFLWLGKALVELRGVISCARSRTSGWTRPAVPRERGPFWVSARFVLLYWRRGGGNERHSLLDGIVTKAVMPSRFLERRTERHDCLASRSVRAESASCEKRAKAGRAIWWLSTLPPSCPQQPGSSEWVTMSAWQKYAGDCNLP